MEKFRVHACGCVQNSAYTFTKTNRNCIFDSVSWRPILVRIKTFAYAYARALKLHEVTHSCRINIDV